MVCDATAKSLGASSRSSLKVNDGKCKWLLLLLSQKNRIPKVEIWRGRFVVFGFSDVTCALLVVGAPTGKFHCCR